MTMSQAVARATSAPQALLDERQRQVDSGGDARGSQVTAVPDVDDVRLDIHFRVPPRQQPGVTPMRRRPPVIKKTKLSQHECAGIYRCDARGAVGKPGHRVEQFPADAIRRQVFGAGDQQRVQCARVARAMTSAVVRTSAGPLTSSIVTRSKTKIPIRLAPEQCGPRFACVIAAPFGLVRGTPRPARCPAPRRARHVARRHAAPGTLPGTLPRPAPRSP